MELDSIQKVRKGERAMKKLKEIEPARAVRAPLMIPTT